MKNNFNLKDGIRSIALSFVPICAMSFCSCSVSRSSERTTDSETTGITSVSTETAMSVSVESSTSDSQVTVSTETTESIEPTQATTYIEGIGEVFVRSENYLSEKDFNALMEKTWDYGYTSLGLDNPKILEIAREYFHNDSLTIEDIGFFQCDMLSDDGHKKNLLDKIKLNSCFDDLSRYFLAVNEGRFMLNQIDYDFFNKHFPEYCKECNNGNARYMRDNFLCSNQYYDELCDISQTEDLSKFMDRYKDIPEAREAMKFHIFITLREYVKSWTDIAGSYANDISFMPITRDTNYDFIVVPSSTTFDKLQQLLITCPHCENFDISKVETYEDLVNSGVDVDVLERAIKYAGLDIPLLSETYNKADESGARTRIG